MAFSQDGLKIAIGTSDGVAQLINIRDKKILQRYYWYSSTDKPIDLGITTTMDIDPNGSIIATAMGGSVPTAFHVFQNSDIFLWGVDNGELITSLKNGHDLDSGVMDVEFSNDGKRLLSGSADGLIIWNIENNYLEYRLYGQNVTSVRLNKNGELALLIGNNDIRLWDLKTRNLLKTIDIGYSNTGTLIQAMDVSPDGKTIIVGGLDTVRADPRTQVVDLKSGEIIKSFDPHGSVMQLRFTPDGHYALEAVGESPDTSTSVYLLDVISGKTINNFGQIGPFSMSPDGKSFYADGSIWDLFSGKEISKHSHGKIGIFSPTNKFVISSPDGISIEIWDPVSENIIHRYIDKSPLVNVIRISNDGRSALSIDKNDLVQWDINTGNVLQRYSGHTDPILAAWFNPDDSTIITGSEDNTLRLWDATNGNELRRERHLAPIYGAEFSPDNNVVVSSSQDGIINIWNMPSSINNLLNWVKVNRYIRELTCDEKINYQIDQNCK